MQHIRSSTHGSRSSYTTPAVALRVTVAIATPWLTLLSCAERGSVFAATATTGQEGSSGEASTSASSTEHSRFNGRWEPCEDRVSGDLARFDEAIESAPSYAHDRLQEFRVPPERPEVFSLEVDSESISMTVDSKDDTFHYEVQAPISGAKTKVRDWKDEEMTASFEIKRGKMIQKFKKFGKGTRTNISTLYNRGNRLKLRVVIESFLLREPFVYVLHYCRA
jgi:hypothetical protein